MKNRKTIYNIIGTLVTVVIILAAVAFAQRVLSDRGHMVNEIAKDERPYEVLLFGNSHMNNGISPMELYSEYGITSYNFGHASEFSPQTYWLVQEAVEKVHPKVIVVECFHSSYNDKFYDDNTLHGSMDAMSLSGLKVKAACDLLEDNNLRLEMLFPIGKYHGRWKELSKSDFEFNHHFGINKGFVYFKDVYQGDFEKNENLYGLMDEVSLGEEYLQKIKDYCDEQGVGVVFTYAPYPHSEKESAIIEKYLSDRGITLLRMDEREEFNYVTDMHNENHLNYSGQVKYTNIMGLFLSENYDLTDYREIDTAWKQDEKEFIDYKLDMVVNRENVYDTLMYLYDDDFSGELYLGNNKLPNDGLLYELINNATDLKVYEGFCEDLEDVYEEEVYLKVYSALTGELLLEKIFEL